MRKALTVRKAVRLDVQASGNSDGWKLYLKGKRQAAHYRNICTTDTAHRDACEMTYCARLTPEQRLTHAAVSSYAPGLEAVIAKFS